MITGITFEAEYYELVLGKLLVWNRAHSRQRFRAGFRIMDVAERVVFDERSWWDLAVATSVRLVLVRQRRSMVSPKLTATS